MRANKITGARIKLLRERSNLSQGDFCKKFSEFANRPSVYSIMTVSCWETGRKIPPADIILNLAAFYSVSTDYIFGLSDEIDEHFNGSKIKNKDKRKIEIPYNDLCNHDGEPVYVQFPNGNFQNQWGILDYKSKTLVFKSFKLKVNSQCHYFYTTPPEEVTIRSQSTFLLNMKDMMKQDRVYIESLSSDPYIQGKITGWYKHSPNKDFLINERGFSLSYEGLGIFYNAVGFYPSQSK